MARNNFGEKVNFLWSIAELLRDRFKRGNYWTREYEVTQKEYEALMGKNPSSFTGDSNRPVEMVSWGLTGPRSTISRVAIGPSNRARPTTPTR